MSTFYSTLYYSRIVDIFAGEYLNCDKQIFQLEIHPWNNKYVPFALMKNWVKCPGSAYGCGTCLEEYNTPPPGYLNIGALL